MDTQELLKGILRDYKKYCRGNAPEKSFIYGYFFKKKRATIEKYTASENDFIKGISALVKGVKIERSHDLSKLTNKGAAVRDNYLLLAISRRAFDFGWISSEELGKVVLKTRKVKKVPPVLLEKTHPDYAAAWEKCLQRLLQKTICDFFNSKGFVLHGSRPSSKRCSPDDRKERDLVDIHSEYLNYLAAKSVHNSPDSTKTSQKETQHSLNEYIENAKRLYRSITDDKPHCDKYKRVLIPIYFDQRVGAGIYLIGEDCFEPNVFEKKNFPCGRVCIPCIVSFYSGVPDNRDCFIHVKEKENFSHPIKADFQMDVEMFETVDKAFATFAVQLAKFRFDHKFSHQNQSVYPPDIDNDFKRILK